MQNKFFHIAGFLVNKDTIFDSFIIFKKSQKIRKSYKKKRREQRGTSRLRRGQRSLANYAEPERSQACGAGLKSKERPYPLVIPNATAEESSLLPKTAKAVDPSSLRSLGMTK
jgi:hypothetical protein